MIAHSVNKTEPLEFQNKSDHNISLIDKITNYNYLKYIPVSERENVYEYFYNLRHQCISFVYVEISLPYNSTKNVLSYNYLGLNQKFKFVNEVKTKFYWELTKHLMKPEKRSIPRTELILEFMKKYYITDDDVDFESLYRQTTRILQDKF